MLRSNRPTPEITMTGAIDAESMRISCSGDVPKAICVAIRLLPTYAPNPEGSIVMTRVNIVCVVSILISRASCLRRKFNRLLKSELRGRLIEALRWTPDSGLADYLTEPHVGLAPIPFNYDLGILVDRALNERDSPDAREIGNSRIPV